MDKLKEFKIDSITIILIFSIIAIVLGIYNLQQINQIKDDLAPVGPNGEKLERIEKVLKDVPKDAQFLGNKDAKVTMIEFADFQCPYCGRFFSQTFPEIKKQYIDTGKIKFIYIDFAILGSESNDAAEASKCALEQGKYWEYHDELFKNQKGENIGTFNKVKLINLATNIGLDGTKFEQCISDNRYDNQIAQEKKLAQRFGISGTPGFVIGKKIVKGSVSFDNFKQVIESELN